MSATSPSKGNTETSLPYAMPEPIVDGDSALVDLLMLRLPNSSVESAAVTSDCVEVAPLL